MIVFSKHHIEIIIDTIIDIRSTITDSHLEQCLRLATTDIEADIDLLVKSKQHHHSY